MSGRDHLGGQDWGRVHAKVLAYAMARTRSRAKASDLAQEAMLRALDARWTPWDPEKHPDIVTFLIGIVNRLLANEHQKRKLHREIAMDRELRGDTGREGDDVAGAVVRRALGGDDADAGRSHKNPLADAGPTPEAAAGDRELQERRLARLRELCAEDAASLAVIEQVELGVDAPAEQAAGAGLSLHDIKTARRRLAPRVEKVVREISEAAPGEAGTHDEP